MGGPPGGVGAPCTINFWRARKNSKHDPRSGLDPHPWAFSHPISNQRPKFKLVGFAPTQTWARVLWIVGIVFFGLRPPHYPVGCLHATFGLHTKFPHSLRPSFHRRPSTEHRFCPCSPLSTFGYFWGWTSPPPTPSSATPHCACRGIALKIFISQNP